VRISFTHRLKALEVQEYALAGVVVALFVAGAILRPDTFPTWDNLRNMLTQASVVGVLAIGMTFVTATAGIDLSVGSMVAAAGMFGGILVGTDGTSSLVFIAGTIAFAILLGTTNATAVAYGRVVPFIATLAMFSIARGVALLLNDKLPVGLLDLNGGSFGDPRAFSLLWFGSGRVAGIPASVDIFIAITIIGWVVLNRTRYGRYVVAVGSNRLRRDEGIDAFDQVALTPAPLPHRRKHRLKLFGAERRDGVLDPALRDA
jgi:ribose transport system permease protein